MRREPKLFSTVVVKVTTEGGLAGYGESHHGRAHTAIAQLVNTTLRQLILGMSATDVVGVWNRIYARQLASHRSLANSMQPTENDQHSLIMKRAAFGSAHSPAAATPHSHNPRSRLRFPLGHEGRQRPVEMQAEIAVKRRRRGQ